MQASMQGHLKFCLMGYKYITSTPAKFRLLVHKQDSSKQKEELESSWPEHRHLSICRQLSEAVTTSVPELKEAWTAQSATELATAWFRDHRLSSHGICREPGAELSGQILSISYILLNLDALVDIPLNLGTYKVLRICPSTFPCQLWLHLLSGYTSQASAEPSGGPCTWSSPAREAMRLWTAALFFEQSLGNRAGRHLCWCEPIAN